MDSVALLIQFAVVTGLLAIAALLVPSIKYHQDDKHSVIIKITLIISIIFLVASTVDKVFDIQATTFSVPRLIGATIAYMLRPILLYALSLSIVRRKLKVELLIAIPIFINVILLIISIPTGIVFSFDNNNMFHRGVLGLFPIIVTAMYLLYLLFNLVMLFKDRHIQEVIPLFFIAVAGVVLTILEMLDIVRNSVDIIFVSGSIFYSLFLNIYYSKRDSLTGLFNHQVYYSDANRMAKKVVAVLSIDMNGLKILNDTRGHQEGDTALVSIAEALDNSKHKGVKVRFYRIGGDEFSGICFSGSAEQVQKLVESIKDNMAKTPYSISIGYKYKESEYETFSDMYRLADMLMYEDKKQYYKDNKLIQKK